MDASTAFRQAMMDAGLICDELPIADGQIHRFHVEGDKPGSRNGWYVLYGDGIPAGAFGSWKNGEWHKWCAKPAQAMTDAERAAYRERIEHAKAERERAQKEAQAKAGARAQAKWGAAKLAATDHPYLVGKGVKPYGIRAEEGCLIVPLRDTEGNIHSLQLIDAEGNKRFLSDGAVQCHYHAIGKLTEPLYLCEGYSTGASIHEATGCGVIVAFNAGNLLPVAKAISGKYPDQALVIAGDNDAWTDGNPGRAKAIEAAEAISAKVVMPEFKDTTRRPTDFNDLQQLEALDAVREQLEPTRKPTDETKNTTTEILENVPESIQRSLCLVNGHGYAATWIWIKTTTHESTDKKTGKTEKHDPPLEREEQHLIVVRDDGKIFTDANLPNTEPISKLGLGVRLGDVQAGNRIWSGAGVKRYLGGEQSDPADVFKRVTEVVDRFMDFNRSLAEQQPMDELVACYIMVTYLLDAFPVVGYLWPNGDRGAGKTHFLFTVTELAYLGQVILAGGSYASLRDLADCGATLAFDDSENIMDLKRADPDKRALLLAGNRRGATVTFKEPTGSRKWVTRHINTFCPRLFSAIRLPDPILASRSITIPLVRSADDDRTTADPLDPDAWPHDRQRLVDDLWAVALTNLKVLRGYDKQAAQCAKLSGRELEPWRAIFAVALWLQEAHGLKGLFDRMEKLSLSYQKERDALESSDPSRLCISALHQLFSSESGQEMEFGTSALTQTVNKIAVENEIVNSEETYTNAKRVGRLLERLRFRKAPRTAKRKRWNVNRSELTALAKSYGMTLPPLQHGTNGNMAQEEVPSCQECHECHDEPEVSSAAINGRDDESADSKVVGIDL